MQRMKKMSIAHAAAINNYTQASQGFVPLPEQSHPPNTLYGQLPSRFNTYTTVNKRHNPTNSEPVYGESGALSRPSNRNSWRPKMPLPETVYASLNQAALRQPTDTAQPLEKTNYGTVAGTQTNTGQIVPLQGSRPTIEQRELLLEQLRKSGNAHAGGYKKTRKNKKTTKHNIRSRKYRK